jgi:hypothetical protein
MRAMPMKKKMSAMIDGDFPSFAQQQQQQPTQ